MSGHNVTVTATDIAVRAFERTPMVCAGSARRCCDRRKGSERDKHSAFVWFAPSSQGCY